MRPKAIRRSTVRAVAAIRQNLGHRDVMAIGPAAQLPIVAAPQGMPPSLDPVAIVQLRCQDGRQHFRWQVARAEIDPAVLLTCPR